MMKQIFVKLALCAGLIVTPYLSMASGPWAEVNQAKAPAQLQLIHPRLFKVYTLNESVLRMKMWNLPDNPDAAEIISLPMPDGSTRDFRVWETPMMPQDLASRYPDIRTFTGTAVDDPTVGAKLDFTVYGFHAMVFDGENTAFIDPFDNFHDGYYMAYYKKDLDRPASQRMICQHHSGIEQDPGGDAMITAETGFPKLAQKTVNGYDLRTYRLALSCSNQYASAATGIPSPTKPQVLSKMTTTMNRVNGVYEREYSVRMAFVSGQDALIFTTAAGDPFNSINSNPGSCLTTNQSQCNSLIGSGNYDIGHVFTTGSGGLATLGCVCTFMKAQGTTGSPGPVGDAFDLDYVAHEMGHQFGSDHTFNNGSSGSCGGGNAESTMAYEPGSGSTIMAYAGICAPDNVQPHSDAYFHSASVVKILAFISGTGDCAAKTATGNKLVKYNAFTPTSYKIPYKTPFELTAPVAIDSMSDSVVLYCWEQMDLGSFGSSFSATTSAGPIFRSIVPSKSQTRVFPKIASVLLGNLNTLYEKAPTVARDMKFRCLFRNIRNNKGCITIPDETLTISASTTPTAEGFKVTSQNSSTTSYAGGSTQTVTWDVVNTTAAPVSTANVDIWMSTNGGNAWQYFVGTFPNTGTASITVPNPPANTSSARIKVKGSGNVFFNVNSTNFQVTYTSTIPVTPNGVTPAPAMANDIKVFPVPADNVLYITSTNVVNAAAYNVMGQRMWEGTVSAAAEINVSTWAKGIYYIRCTDAARGTLSVKQVVIQ